MDINQQAETLKTFLKTQQPDWVITRDLSLFESNRAGIKTVLTIVVGSGRATGNGSLNNAPPNDVTVLLVGQKNLCNQEANGEEIEAIELGIRTGIRAALDSPQLPPDIAGAMVKNWTTSGQQNKERAEILLTMTLKEN